MTEPPVSAFTLTASGPRLEQFTSDFWRNILQLRLAGCVSSSRLLVPWQGRSTHMLAAVGLLAKV